MRNTRIAWCDHTFNPWWGCAKVSPGCFICYAEAWAVRDGYDIWGPNASRRFFGDYHWRQPETWNREALRDGERARVFCASMADVFEDRADLSLQRARLWDLIERTPGLDWQLLTKRPENIASMVPPRWMDDWPWHVWIGASAEDQEWADRRARELVRIPASVRFLSAEPLLSPIPALPLDGIHWVIPGGESGETARPCAVEWIADLVRQCRAANVACFVKQLGRYPTLEGARMTLRTYKGDDPAEWPQELCVLEFPRGRRLSQLGDGGSGGVLLAQEGVSLRSLSESRVRVSSCAGNANDE